MSCESHSRAGLPRGAFPARINLHLLPTSCSATPHCISVWGTDPAWGYCLIAVWMDSKWKSSALRDGITDWCLVLLFYWNTVDLQCWASLIGQLVKKSTCNARDPGLIPGSGRSAEEGIGYPLQYFGASLVAQLVKNLSAVQEIWVRSLGWEDPLEKGTATHSSILAWRIPRTAHSPWGL